MTLTQEWHIRKPGIQALDELILIVELSHRPRIAFAEEAARIARRLPRWQHGSLVQGQADLNVEHPL